MLVIVIGIILMVGGTWGMWYTYKHIAQEKITTPTDASLPEQKVRGPFTLKAQADVIREHTLRSTEGKTFAEMPRTIPKIDENGEQMTDAQGKIITEPNTSRDIWITATTLTTALNVGIMSYVVSGVVVLMGCLFIWNGIVFYVISRRAI